MTILKNQFPILRAAAALFILSASSHAQVLQVWDGPIIVTGGGVGHLLVNTADDTGDWITSNGNYTTGTATAPLYFRFTLSVTNNAGETGSGGFFTGFQLSMGLPTSMANERLAVGNGNLSVNWGGYSSGVGNGDYNLNGNAGVGGVNPITPTETVSFIMKLTQSTNSATIWFNPNVALSELAQDAGLTTSLSGMGSKDTFDGIYLRAGQGTGSTTFSNMSVSLDSPFAAVPEPAEWGAIMVTGLLALALLRRRPNR